MQLKPAIHWMLLNVLLVKLSEEPAPSIFSLSINMILYDFFSVFPFFKIS
jgi:K+-sensing histidine kinase KdpD